MAPRLSGGAADAAVDRIRVYPCRSVVKRIGGGFLGESTFPFGDYFIRNFGHKKAQELPVLPTLFSRAPIGASHGSFAL